MRRCLIFIFVLVVLAAIFWGSLELRNDAYEKNLEEAYAAGAEVVTETTVPRINDVRVPIGNYIREDSSFVGGQSIQFMLPDGPLTVTIGTTFAVGTKQYKVLNIWEGNGDYASVSYIEVPSN